MCYWVQLWVVVVKLAPCTYGRIFSRCCWHIFSPLKDRRGIRLPYIPFVVPSSGDCCIHTCTRAGRKLLLLEVYQNICLRFSNGCVMLIAFRCKAWREFDAEGNRTGGGWGNNRWFSTHSCIMQMRVLVCDRQTSLQLNWHFILSSFFQEYLLNLLTYLLT